MQYTKHTLRNQQKVNYPLLSFCHPIQVRLNRFKVKLTVRNDDPLVTPHHHQQDSPHPFDPEDELLEEYDPSNPGVDPARVVYEKTTITSEVTLHVGRRKSVRTLTITTSVPKTRYAHHPSIMMDPLVDAHHDISPAHNNAIFATVGHALNNAPHHEPAHLGK